MLTRKFFVWIVSWRRLGIVILAGVLVGIGWLVISLFNDTPSDETVIVAAQPVSTALPSRKTLHAIVTVAGAWVAREEVAISSPLDGLRVTEVLVESGESVTQGQVLVRLERETLDSQVLQADQAVKRARVEAAQATEQYERTRLLQPTGAVSRQDYSTHRAAMLGAQAALRQAQAAWDEQRLRQAHSEIRSPAAGIISQRSVQVGSMVGTQSTLFRLINDSRLEFQVQIPQQILPELSIGMPAQIKTRNREGMLEGRIRLIGIDVDATTGYGHARIAPEPRQQVITRPGSVGDARIVFAQREEVLALDIRALRYDSGKGLVRDRIEPYVFVVDDGRVRRTPVHVGLREEGWVEIREGVDASSEVVVAGASFLQDGDKVLPKILETPLSILYLRHSWQLQTQRSIAMLSPRFPP